MLESGWLFIGRIAFIWTLAVVLVAIKVDSADDPGDAIAIVGGAVGFVLWAVWTFGTLNIEVIDGGSTTVFTHPELTLLGIAMAMVPGYIALTGPIDLINRARDPSADQL